MANEFWGSTALWSPLMALAATAVLTLSIGAWMFRHRLG